MPLAASNRERDPTKYPLHSRPGHGRYPASERAPWPITINLRPGTDRLHARKAEDGTLWCATCNRTHDPAARNRVFCQTCSAQRDSLRHQPDQPDLRVVDWALLGPLLDHITALEGAFGAAFPSWSRHKYANPQAMDALFVVAKDVIDRGSALNNRLT